MSPSHAKRIAVSVAAAGGVGVAILVGSRSMRRDGKSRDPVQGQQHCRPAAVAGHAPAEFDERDAGTASLHDNIHPVQSLSGQGSDSSTEAGLRAATGPATEAPPRPGWMRRMRLPYRPFLTAA